MACEEIQDLLYDYLTHTIGRARGELIREHIRKCDDCRTVAADVQTTLDLLKDASSQQSREPMSLTDDRRRRLWRAFMHPVLDWLYSHHILVSVAVAIAAVIVTLFVVKGVQIIWKVRKETDSPQPRPHIMDIMTTNAPDNQGWYMIQGKDGQTWFYHPDGATNGAGRAQTDS